MVPHHNLLVIGEAPSVCLSCRQVLAPQGFLVDGSTDPHEGLDWVRHRAYEGVLLDDRMRRVNGRDCLEELRKTDPQLPILVIRDQPGVETWAASPLPIASEYVTRPFSRGELSQSVHRMLNNRPFPAGGLNLERVPHAEDEGPWDQEFRFHDEAWLQLDADGRARVGTVLPGLSNDPSLQIRLPTRGELVFRGLPLAGVTDAKGFDLVVPAPLTGIITATNDMLRQDPSALREARCGRGWMVCMGPTHLEEELGRCRPRRVILANATETSRLRQRRELRRLGCAVRVAKDRESLVQMMAHEPEDAVLFLDADSFGAKGPRAICEAMDALPTARLVLIAPIPPECLARYRAQRLLYFAVVRFERESVAEVLDAVFRLSPSEPIRQRLPSGSAHPGDDIRAKGEYGHETMLLAEPGLLEGPAHLGERIRECLMGHSISFVNVPSADPLDTDAIAQAARGCDHLVLLRARDRGRLPGSLHIADDGPEHSLPGSKIKLTTLEVQPRGSQDDRMPLDRRTAKALAEAIVREMTANTAPQPRHIARSRAVCGPLQPYGRGLDEADAAAS